MGVGYAFGVGEEGFAVKAWEMEKAARAEAIGSLQRYFAENMPEEIGELPAGLLLDFFVEEIGPLIYNQAVSEAQTRMELRVADLSGELFADAFQYWPKVEARRKKR